MQHPQSRFMQFLSLSLSLSLSLTHTPTLTFTCIPTRTHIHTLTHTQVLNGPHEKISSIVCWFFLYDVDFAQIPIIVWGLHMCGM